MKNLLGRVTDRNIEMCYGKYIFKNLVLDDLGCSLFFVLQNFPITILPHNNESSHVQKVRLKYYINICDTDDNATERSMWRSSTSFTTEKATRISLSFLFFFFFSPFSLKKIKKKKNTSVIFAELCAGWLNENLHLLPYQLPWVLEKKK